MGLEGFLGKSREEGPSALGVWKDKELVKEQGKFIKKLTEVNDSLVRELEELRRNISYENTKRVKEKESKLDFCVQVECPYCKEMFISQGIKTDPRKWV